MPSRLSACRRSHLASHSARILRKNWVGMAPRTVPSKTWSSSELKDGQKKLMEVKSERLSEAELREQIKDLSLKRFATCSFCTG